MSSRRIKKEILTLLGREDLGAILEQLEHYPPKGAINVLFSAICHHDELIRWHGISGMGSCVARLAEHDMEEARIVMRRLLWSLNDESGGIGWGAPESLAESMYHHYGLAREYCHMLVSYMCEDGEEIWQDGNFLEHLVLQRGVVWGVARLAGKRRQLLLQHHADEHLVFYLESADTTVRGLAVLACGRLAPVDSIPHLERLRRDKGQFRFYEQGRLTTLQIGPLAAHILEKFDHGRSVPAPGPGVV